MTEKTYNNDEAHQGEYNRYRGVDGIHRTMRSENGRLVVIGEGSVKDGKLEGEYKLLNPDGSVKSTKNYENGYLKEQQADGSILYIDEEKNKIHKHVNKDGVDDTAEYLISLKIEKLHKRLKDKGLMKEDAPDNKPITKPGKILTSLAIKRAKKSLGE